MLSVLIPEGSYCEQYQPSQCPWGAGEQSRSNVCSPGRRLTFICSRREGSGGGIKVAGTRTA